MSELYAWNIKVSHKMHGVKMNNNAWKNRQTSLMNLNNRQNSRVNYNENEHQCVDLDTDNDDYKLKISTSFRNKKLVSSWKQETTETNWCVICGERSQTSKDQGGAGRVTRVDFLFFRQMMIFMKLPDSNWSYLQDWSPKLLHTW